MFSLLTVLSTIGAIIFVVWVQNNRKNPPKILNVYTQPGKWFYLKYLAFLTILKVRQIHSKIRQSTKRDGGSGLGQNTRETESELDQLKELSPHEKVCVYIYY